MSFVPIFWWMKALSHTPNNESFSQLERAQWADFEVNRFYLPSLKVDR